MTTQVTMQTEQNREPLLVAEAGMPYTIMPEGDGIAAWLDLMEVVEALCPSPPAKKPLILRDCRL